ncbi:hypothetical protein FACS1894201_04380 [Bacteroidia bacterium]|nr:hypothetical protein FACS1894201_04380 [Bacteroidia bacterium]
MKKSIFVFVMVSLLSLGVFAANSSIVGNTESLFISECSNEFESLVSPMSVDVYAGDPLSDDVSLLNLTVQDTIGVGALSPAFDPDTLSYTVTVENSVTTVLFTATKNVATQDIDYNGYVGGLVPNLAEGNANILSITVTAENGDTRTYQITIIRLPPSTIATLDTITVSVGNLSPAFRSDSLNYTVTVANNVHVLTIAAITTYRNAVVSGGGIKNLIVGVNTYDLIVTAENGTTRTYQVKVIREAPNDVTLYDISVNAGFLTPNFHTDSLHYMVNVPKNQSSIELTIVKNDVGQTITINGVAPALAYTLVAGDNEFRIVVTAEDLVTTRTYTVNVVRAAPIPLLLRDITVSTGMLTPAFDSTKTDYEVIVPNITTNITLTAVKASNNHTIIGDGPKSLLVGRNIFPIVVSDEDGDALVYMVTVIRAFNNDATLSTLNLLDVVGELLTPEFNKDSLNYTVQVPNTTLSVMIVATKSYPTQMITGLGTKPLSVGNNVFDIVVTAEDSITQRTYKIVVVRAANSDATLMAIMTSATTGALTPAFSPTIFNYTINVRNEENNISVMAIRKSVTQSVAITSGGVLALKVGDSNTCTIIVTAEDGTTVHNYIIRINRAKSTDAGLGGLSVSEGSLVEAFHKDRLSYRVDIPNSVVNITFTVTAAHSEQVITGAGQKINLPVGESTFKIHVTAEDTNYQREYTIVVDRAAPEIIEPPISAVGETLPEQTLQVYPNPTAGLVYVTTDEQNPVVLIYDIKGNNVTAQCIVRTPDTNGQLAIDFSPLPAGVYFLNVDGSRAKIIKQL